MIFYRVQDPVVTYPDTVAFSASQVDMPIRVRVSGQSLDSVDDLPIELWVTALDLA